MSDEIDEAKVAYSDIVYRVPGVHSAYNGKTYDYCAVKSKEEHAQKLEEGWCDSLVEAVEGKNDAVQESNSNTTDGNVGNNSPPTRDEIKAKADELGIEYQKNIPSGKLLALVEAKLSEGK